MQRALNEPIRFPHMTQSLSPRITPACIGDVIDAPNGDAGWCSRVRRAVQVEGQALRAGDDLSIQAKSLRTNEWMSLLLPGGSTQFATARDRDDALRFIQQRDGQS